MSNVSRISHTHLRVGLLLFLVAAIVLPLQLVDTGRLFSQAIEPRIVHLLTGGILAFTFVWQWRLFVSRYSGPQMESASQLSTHQWVGNLIILCLLIHAATFGFRSQIILSATLLTIIGTGLLHSTVVKLRSPTLQHIWKWLHVGLAGAIVPLILLHIWSAFAFKEGS